MMNIHRDFEEFLQLLNDHQVEYVIVGGYAVAFHGYVRATKDIDLFFRNSEKNITKICNVLSEFGLPVSKDERGDFGERGAIIRIGVSPIMIELINDISGVSFEEVWENRLEGKYGGVSVDFISFENLLKNKKQSGRPKDLADYDELGGNRS